jgi:hypothetical protein
MGDIVVIVVIVVVIVVVTVVVAKAGRFSAQHWQRNMKQRMMTEGWNWAVDCAASADAREAGSAPPCHWCQASCLFSSWFVVSVVSPTCSSELGSQQS